MDKAVKTKKIKENEINNCGFCFPEKVLKSILKIEAKAHIINRANANEGTNKKRSPIFAPLIINKLLVGEEAKKKKKIQKDNIGNFRIRNIAIISKVPYINNPSQAVTLLQFTTDIWL